MYILIGIGVLMIIGVIILLRPAPDAPSTPKMSDADALVLRDAVIDRLRDRLVGWTFEPSAEKPLELTAIDTGTERRIDMNLNQLAQTWYPAFVARRLPEADDVIESFAAGVSGQDEGTDTVADASALHSALALKLVPAASIPKATFHRPAGTLAAVLVLRRPGGADAVAADGLEAMELSESEAFATALENLKLDVEEGLPLDPLGETTPPEAVAVAPSDSLATGYALVPGLASKVRHALGDRDCLLYLDEDSLVVAVVGVEVERGTALVAEGVSPDALAWKTIPA